MRKTRQQVVTIIIRDTVIRGTYEGPASQLDYWKQYMDKVDYDNLMSNLVELLGCKPVNASRVDVIAALQLIREAHELVEELGIGG